MVMKKPKISIIVPVYNLESYLEDCLDSILNQTFRNIEVILVNDGSIDVSGFICDAYAKKDERVRVIHKEYGGVSSARNIGVKVAKGEFIGFVDGDDRIHEDMYKVLYDLCQKTNSDISICKLGREIEGKLINGHGEQFVKEMDNFEAMKQMFQGEIYRFSLCNKLFRNSCFSNNTMFPLGRIHEDLATTYLLFSKARKVIYTNYIGYIYVKRENSILTSIYNEKRLDAYYAWDEILMFTNRYYNRLSPVVSKCFAYWVLDNINYINNQVEDDQKRKEYMFTIQKYTKRYSDLVHKHTQLSKRCKIIFLLLNKSVKMLNLTLKLSKLKKVHR
jgi:glycosyltransferase involved in cell wall biosynthesis